MGYRALEVIRGSEPCGRDNYANSLTTVRFSDACEVVGVSDADPSLAKPGSQRIDRESPIPGPADSAQVRS